MADEITETVVAVRHHRRIDPVLLIPLLLIGGTVQDRARHRDAAVERAAQSKAGEQQFIAPVRVLPFTEDVQVTEPDEQGNPRKLWRK
ncbi:hypothetical protein XpopCFBP1817_18400 [Xanthomonas populi]|uniref:Uncharacterized protein n=1 Tax=Xanthomonas populi TaxID=53414 RepID=A0A2S7EAW1_9XANT|nr:hypothetical protein XpopCFBP1817_18400 [Xanthomonas populi]